MPRLPSRSAVSKAEWREMVAGQEVLLVLKNRPDVVDNRREKFRHGTRLLVLHGTLQEVRFD
jgi:hypothetical protein